MKRFLGNLAQRFQNFMYGRYGVDQLFKALMILYLVLTIISAIVGRFSSVSYYVLYTLNMLVIIYAFYRVFSKKLSARSKENEKYMMLIWKVKDFFSLQKNKFKQRKTHKFVKCKSCKKTLRLPRHKGKIKVNCPHCHNEFIINTGKKA